MDGKGRWRDNVFVERVWKSIKYEEVYLHAYELVSQARTSIGRYLEFYNSVRPHSSLGAFTPDQVYFNRLPKPMAAQYPRPVVLPHGKQYTRTHKISKSSQNEAFTRFSRRAHFNLGIYTSCNVSQRSGKVTPGTGAGSKAKPCHNQNAL